MHAFDQKGGHLIVAAAGQWLIIKLDMNEKICSQEKAFIFIPDK